MSEIKKYSQIEKRRKKAVFIIVAVVILGYVSINFIYKPYLTTNGKESRLWNEQEKKTNAILENACSLKTDHPLYVKLKTECEKRKKGVCPFEGVNDNLYCPSEYSAEPPEPYSQFGA